MAMAPKKTGNPEDDDTQARADLAGRLLGQAAELSSLAGHILEGCESAEDQQDGAGPEELGDADAQAQNDRRRRYRNSQ